VLAVLLLVVAPAVSSENSLEFLAKYCCWAIVAVGIGLAWGRGGMLVMGQGVFFALGAYAMAMHLTLEASGGTTPSFMILYDPTAPLPAWWRPFTSGGFTIAAIIVAPVVVAAVLGYALFKRRVKGAYFAILTQALAVALATLLSGTIRQTGGDTGLSNFKTFFGFLLSDEANIDMIFTYIVIALIVCMLIAWQLYRSRFGELLVATRDAEERVRFLGYDPANIKLVAFVIAAVMASIGGALFVPIVGIITPKDIDAAASIMLIAGVALGGRASLFGPVLGALAVGWGSDKLSDAMPNGWIYLKGAMFIVVILLLPGGLASIAGRLRRRTSSAPAGAHAARPEPAGGAA
jgi:urea transport system permease protein